MKLALALALALISLPALAGNEQHVSASTLKETETATDTRFTVEPWEMLGFTRGTYLPGYGVVFTFEMSLVQSTPLSPFHRIATPLEKKTLHDRKIKQLAILKDTMRDLVVKTAFSLAALPPTENIIFEAHLLSQTYEDTTGLPWRLSMSANRQKILDATARHASAAELAALIEERKE